MNKTVEHVELERRLRAAELAAHSARLAVETARRELREYRRANYKTQNTRVGPKVIRQVEEALAVGRFRRPSQIAKEIGRSDVSVREVLKRLASEGRAVRLGKPGQHTFYAAAPRREAAE